MAKAALLSVNIWGYSDTSLLLSNLIKDCWRARAAVPKQRCPRIHSRPLPIEELAVAELWERLERGRGRDCRDGVTSGGDHHNGRITIRTCSGEARVCKRVGQVKLKQNKQKSNKNRSKVQENQSYWQKAPAMVSSREELWQEWTGSRSERRQEELCRSAQSDLAHWQGQHPL